MFADQAPYSQFNLVRDMLAAADAIQAFDPSVVKTTAAEIASVGKLLFTGEGSSRLFPAKSAIRHSRQQGWATTLHTEAGRQSQDYALADWAVLGMSNSGRTAEVIRLFTSLKVAGHSKRYSLTAAADSPLEALANRGHVLACGKEGAVAATKTVVEQALFCRALVESMAGHESLAPRLARLAEQVRTALHYAMKDKPPNRPGRSDKREASHQRPTSSQFKKRVPKNAPTERPMALTLTKQPEVSARETRQTFLVIALAQAF